MQDIMKPQTGYEKSIHINHNKKNRGNVGLANQQIEANSKKKRHFISRVKDFILFRTRKISTATDNVNEKIFYFAQSAGEIFEQPVTTIKNKYRGRERARNKFARINAFAVMMLISGTALVFGFFNFGVAVNFNGQHIGFVSNQDDFTNAVDSVNAHVSELLGESFILEHDVSYNFSLVDDRRILTQTELEDILFETVPDLTEAYLLQVDGITMGAAHDRTIIDALEEEFLKHHRISEYGHEYGGVTVELETEIQTVLGWTLYSNIMVEEELREIFFMPIREEVIATLSAGQSIDALAASYGMTTETLQGFNEELNGENIEGAEVIISPALPLISIAYTERITYEAVIPFVRTQQYDSNLFRGETRIRQSGRTGLHIATYDVRTVNGFEVSREQVNSELITEAVNEIVAIGTRQRPTVSVMPSGRHIHPLRGVGRVSSNFGMRRRGMHWGIDIAAPSGTPIVATDAGVVIHAGWHGGHGNTVIIDHGNGVRTLYAHASRLHVRVGDRVQQNQHIANVGSTGNSTGPHLHYEIVINGVRVNPRHHVSF